MWKNYFRPARYIVYPQFTVKLVRIQFSPSILLVTLGTIQSEDHSPFAAYQDF